MVMVPQKKIKTVKNRCAYAVTSNQKANNTSYVNCY